MIRIAAGLAFVLSILAPAASAAAQHWSGSATLGGDATEIRLSIEPCGGQLCATLSLPELGYSGLKLRPGAEEGGRLTLPPLRLTRRGDDLVGELAGHGGGYLIDAMGHGAGPAKVELRPTGAPTGAYRRIGIRFPSGDLTLSGTLILPPGEGPFPAIVQIHGSGPAVRWYGIGRAERFAALGFASFVYDKRGSGESQGDWTAASLDDLSSDVIAAMAMLAARPEVDPARIGLWGHSQGGWIIPRAVALGGRPAFAIAVAGGGLTPQQVERHDFGRALAHSGAKPAETRRAMALVERYFTYLADGTGYEALKADIEATAGLPWAEALGLHRALPPPEMREKWRWVAVYDPAQDIAAMQMPLLVVAGERDRPALTSAFTEGWSASLSAAQRAQTVVRVIAGADHHMRAEGGGGWARLAPSYEEIIGAWLQERR